MHYLCLTLFISHNRLLDLAIVVLDPFFCLHFIVWSNSICTFIIEQIISRHVDLQIRWMSQGNLYKFPLIACHSSVVESITWQELTPASQSNAIGEWHVALLGYGVTISIKSTSTSVKINSANSFIYPLALFSFSYFSFLLSLNWCLFLF